MLSLLPPTPEAKLHLQKLQAPTALQAEGVGPGTSFMVCFALVTSLHSLIPKAKTVL